MQDVITAAPASVIEPAHPLPFVHRDGATTSFWAPDRTGEYEVQCARGRAYADALLAHMRETRNPTLYGAVMRGITSEGVYGGVEIGFCNRIGIELIGL